MDDITTYVATTAAQVKRAAPKLSVLSAAVKNNALLAMADALVAASQEIIEANQQDLLAGRERGLTDAMLDRLTLNAERIEQMAAGLREVAALPDPVGAIDDMTRRPEGFLVGRMRVPIGVIGIIYESRPNVTADATALCIKSGNGVVLKGGSEAIHSNSVIARILNLAGGQAGLPEHCVALLETTDRQAVTDMLKQTRSIDLIIPRGGAGLVNFVTENSRIPVIAHDKGLCHTYIDRAADLGMAINIAVNAKAQRPGVCNALETLLVHQEVAEILLPRLAERLREAGVTVHACEHSIQRMPGSLPATAEDWDTEWLSLDLSVKVVDSYDDALEHIARHGSRHTEVIITQDHSTAMRFLREVDAAAVHINASSRLHDGSVLGLGAEIGISTARIHARGAMGLTELTCQKFVVLGDGQIRV